MLKKLKDASPSTIAREALQRLALLRIPPTPDNYQKTYDEIAGNGNNQMCASAKKFLSELAAEIPRSTQELINLSNTLARAIREHDWEKYKLTLLDQVVPSDEVIASAARKTPQNTSTSWNKTIEVLLKQLEKNHGNLTTARKREGLQRVLSRFSNDPAELQDKLHALVDSWKILATDADDKIEVLADEHVGSLTVSVEPNPADKEHDSADLSKKSAMQPQYTDQLPELLAHILEHVAAIPLSDPAFTMETNDLVQIIRRAQSKQERDQFIYDYAPYLEKFEFSIEDTAKLQREIGRAHV